MSGHVRAIHNRVEARKDIMPTNERSEEREQLAADVRAFVRAGGKIEKIKTGLVNYKTDIEKTNYYHIAQSKYKRGVN